MGEDQVFIRQGRRHHRKHYSKGEVRAGLAVLLGLVTVAGWVTYRGAHPDPELFATIIPKTGTVELVDRGPIPEALALDGWQERTLSQFTPENLYEKINGRESYYKSYGFEQLFFVSLAHEQNPIYAVDIETYDLGSAANALGAYAGERAPEASSQLDELGMWHRTENAFFVARGRFYVRAIGSHAHPTVERQLDHLTRVLGSAIASEPLPWAYALFVGQMGLEPSKVTYQAENAFSFGFAKRVYAGLTGQQTEVFVVANAQPQAASAQAEQFTKGFLSYGSRVLGHNGPWVKDRFIGSMVHGHIMIGSQKKIVFPFMALFTGFPAKIFIIRQF